MIVHDVIQGSQEWLDIRVGVITASEFNKVLTPKTKKLSEQAKSIERKIAAQRLIEEDEVEFFGNAWTDRGNEYEDEAVSLYEILKECEAQKVGFITNDDLTIGCSPDRLIGEDGGLEIKCPSAHNHINFLLDKNVEEEYRCQVQGCLMVTGRKWWDVMSYHPKLPPVIKRVERDEEFINALSEALEQLLININETIERVEAA